jgi:hypothetical protein
MRGRRACRHFQRQLVRSPLAGQALAGGTGLTGRDAEKHNRVAEFRWKKAVPRSNG